jgi:hypothetical protein
MTVISYPPPLGTGVPAPASNVPESVPSAPPDTVIVNAVPVASVSGLSSTQFMLENVLQVDSPQQGLPAQNAVVSITNLPASALQAFRWA